METRIAERVQKGSRKEKRTIDQVRQEIFGAIVIIALAIIGLYTIPPFRIPTTATYLSLSWIAIVLAIFILVTAITDFMSIKSKTKKKDEVHG